MFWIVAIIIVAVIASFMDSGLGKLVMSAGVIAIGLLLLKWITGVELFITLAKACAIIIVVVIIGMIVLAIAGN